MSFKTFLVWVVISIYQGKTGLDGGFLGYY